MLRHLIVAALFVISVFPTLGQQVNGEATYISFSVPGGQGTYPMSINASMTVTGYYYASSTVARGFVRQADGTITTFDVAGSGWTAPESINDAGDITGYYENLSQNSYQAQSFVRYVDGHITTFNPPCAYDCGDPHPYSTNPPSITYSINTFGEVVGSYPHTSGMPAGFSRSLNGSFTTYDGELAAPQSGEPHGVVTTAINSSGTVTGSPQGAITLFNPPGALVTSPSPGLTYQIDTPTFPICCGSSFQTGSFASAPHRLSINQAGSVTGSYTDAAGAQYGFVRNPYGTITSFDPPEGHQTTATAINDDGVITGSYVYHGTNPTSIGFLRIPVVQP